MEADKTGERTSGPVRQTGAPLSEAHCEALGCYIKAIGRLTGGTLLSEAGRRQALVSRLSVRKQAGESSSLKL